MAQSGHSRPDSGRGGEERVSTGTNLNQSMPSTPLEDHSLMTSSSPETTRARLS